ncbi:MAG: aconitase family protein [Polyangiaceae bacterium]
MVQKILAGRSRDPENLGDSVEAKIDHAVVVREPQKVLAEMAKHGAKPTQVEVALGYDGACVTNEGFPAVELIAKGMLVARAGAGFPAAVHLERFASPARLCLTDDPRLAGVGGIGMLSLTVTPQVLGKALATGLVQLRTPRSVQVLLTGRLRPFVGARDVALELIRRGLPAIVARVEKARNAPVVLELAGPSVRALSVAERAVVASIATSCGAAGALFASDERTEVFLRDERRSKAHRALVPDPGAPCDEVLGIDLGAVDPLVLDESGNVRSARDLAGRPVSQVIIGGDNGTTLRDFFAVAALLKAKRVPSHIDFLLAVPSRQMLEVLASSGALSDLVAAGARLIEPDSRLIEDTLYAAKDPATSVRTFEPWTPGSKKAPRHVVASAETIAQAVATGAMGDPRGFRRPVRLTLPRELPTDDVLIARAIPEKKTKRTPSED